MNDHEEFRISEGRPSPTAAARGDAHPPVPRIRFKEFGGAWETRPLGELFSIRNESNESGEVREILSVLKDVGVIPYSEKGRIGNRAKDDVTKYRIARKGDIVLNSMNVIIGSVGYSAYDGCISPVYYALTPNENADSPFWGRWFWRNEAKQMLSRVACGMMEIRRKVSEADLLEIQTPAPSLPEQQRIAELFRNLDETIAATDARLEKLRQSKKSLLEKMFPRPGATIPEIRFKGFEGEWKTRKLGEAFPDSIPNNTFSRAALSDSGIVRNVHYGDVLIRYGSVLDIATAKMPFVGDTGFDPQKQCLLKNGDIVIADTAEDSAVGKAIEITGIREEKVVSGLHTIALRPAELFGRGFVGQYLNSESYHHQLLPIMQGVKVLSIGKKVLAETRFQTPSLPEQQRIGAFFCEFDKLIESVQKKAAKLRQVKSALLEEMFV